MTPWYNDPIAMVEYCYDLGKFHELIAARHKAYYVRQERLNTYCLLGRYMTDACGNFGRFGGRREDATPADLICGLPSVITSAELKSLLRIPNDIPEDQREFFGFYLSCSSVGIPKPGDICDVCEAGWNLSNAKDSDIGSEDVWRHIGCWRAFVANDSRARFESMLSGAGLNFKLEQIPNQYHLADYHMAAPWFRIHTDFGPIVMGRRAKVFSIDWKKASVDRQKLAGAFVFEEVTKWDTGIHAWSEEKAIEYLKAIKESAHV